MTQITSWCWLNSLAGWTILKTTAYLTQLAAAATFLFLGLKALKDIEHKSHLEAAAMGPDREADLVTGPHNMLGIELNEYAAELARVTVWIGELQWRLSHGYEFKKNPVLQPLDNIECRDALISFVAIDSSVVGVGSGNEVRAGQTPAAHTLRFLKSPQMSAPPAPQTTVSSASNLGSDPRPQGAGSDPNLRVTGDVLQSKPVRAEPFDRLMTGPVEASWPWASIAIGNPPFLGQRFQVRELGETYIRTLRAVYSDKVSGNVDLVCYWFVKALNALKFNRLGAVGLVATNSIRDGDNRAVLTQIAMPFQIFNAWSDEEWVHEGAAVRVSLVSFGNSTDLLELNVEPVGSINADLSAARSGETRMDLTTATALVESQKAAFAGFKMNGSFDISTQIAHEWLASPNPHCKSNSEVLHPYANARDIKTRSRNRWVIYFPNLSEVDASLYEKPFDWVLHHVKADRQTKREEALRQKCWLHERSRPELRRAISGLLRIIATPMVSKFRIFAWLPTIQIPKNAAIVLARGDDTTFGILHSLFHEVWSLKMCTWMGKGNDPSYTPTTCFETFPFPKSLTPADTAHQKTETIAGGALIPADITTSSMRTGIVSLRVAAEEIAQAAKRLNDLREAWLNPPDWTDSILEVTPLGMTISPYPDRILPKPGHEKDLAERTLTKLYNVRPAWLDAAYKTLDEAVAVAYGWADYTFEMPDEEILKRLLALNLQRSSWFLLLIK